jgi:hypothetical protein
MPLGEAQSLAQSAQSAQFYEALPSTLPLQSFFTEEMEKVNKREKEKNQKNEQIEQNYENKKKDKKKDKNNNNSNNQFTGLMTMDNILHLYHTITLPNYYPKSVHEVGNNENKNTSENDRKNDRKNDQNVIYFPKLSEIVLKYRDQQAYYQEQRTVEENTQFYQSWVDKWGDLDETGERIYGVSDEEDSEEQKREEKNNNENDEIDQIMVETMIERSLLRKKGEDLEHNIDHKHYKFKTHTPTREELKQTQEMHSMYTLYTILLSIALGILIIFSILFLWMSSFSVLCFIRQVSNNQDLNFSCFKNGKVTTILLFIFGLLPTGIILFLGIWNSFYYFLRRFGCAQPLKEFHF